MIAACAPPIPLPRIPVHVTVVRGGRPYAPAPGVRPFLQAGDSVRVQTPAVLRFAFDGNRYRIAGGGEIGLRCARVDLARPRRRTSQTAVLAVTLTAGTVAVESGPHARRALVLSPEMLAFATAAGTRFTADRNPRTRATRASTDNLPIVAARTSDSRLRIDAQPTYTAISDRRGLRLDIWPFPLSPLQRPPTPADRLVPYWADGLPCSIGCTPRGTIPGWPLKPFGVQHAIRAGINELRPANFHVGVDIEADNFQPVYALQSGTASIRYRRTGDVNVDVGAFDYWHIKPAVRPGQRVVAYRTVIGHVLYGFYHVALSERGPAGQYLNPLRPGGSLQPYADTEPPVIGVPRVFADGRVIVRAFDPQSFVARGRYETPVLAPSSLAWRLYDARGRALTGLQWAMRGSQNYGPELKTLIFAPGAANPGFACFMHRLRCIPNWVYRLAGGLTAPLPLAALPPGRYRLTVYAWDWAGNTSALDDWIRLPLR